MKDKSLVDNLYLDAEKRRKQEETLKKKYAEEASKFEKFENNKTGKYMIGKIDRELEQANHEVGDASDAEEEKNTEEGKLSKSKMIKLLKQMNYIHEESTVGSFDYDMGDELWHGLKGDERKGV